MVPYHISLNELEKLKLQLKELLQNEFIQPNILSREAQIVLARKKEKTTSLYVDCL